MRLFQLSIVPEKEPVVTVNTRAHQYVDDEHQVCFNVYEEPEEPEELDFSPPSWLE